MSKMSKAKLKATAAARTAAIGAQPEPVRMVTWVLPAPAAEVAAGLFDMAARLSAASGAPMPAVAQTAQAAAALTASLKAAMEQAPALPEGAK